MTSQLDAAPLLANLLCIEPQKECLILNKALWYYLQKTKVFLLKLIAF